tara:strand:- start:357 stop:644 length:288 start_codon:yes stop_codon:yes gene_type:complete
MDNNNMKYINTDNLTAIIYEDGDIKLQVYNNYPSPYGYVKRDLLSSDIAKKPEEFTYYYIKQQIDKKYDSFNYEEINELINKIKTNESKTNKTLL